MKLACSQGWECSAETPPGRMRTARKSNAPVPSSSSSSGRPTTPVAPSVVISLGVESPRRTTFARGMPTARLPECLRRESPAYPLGGRDAALLRHGLGLQLHGLEVRPRPRLLAALVR